MTILVPDSFTSRTFADQRDNSARRPDFFIIGAPKAGTTSLYAYLAAHPKIFMSRPKEPFYFCEDLPGLRTRRTFVTDAVKYLRLFTSANNQHLMCGEASTLYLLSRVAVPNILAFRPDARFIVMLRNPVDLVHAYHSQIARAAIESVADFEGAWRLQESRERGQHIPTSCEEPAVLKYRQIGSLGEQMERLLNHVSRDRVKILMLEDLAANPKDAYEQVLSFLGVPSDQRSAFPHQNANQTHRSSIVARMVKTPPFPLNILRDQYRRRVGVGTWPARVFHQLNSKPASRTSLSAEFRRELETEFHDDVRLLERLIERDLSRWIAPRRQVVRPARLVG